LPAPARRYIERIERDASCPAIVVSVGSRRDQTIAVRDPFAS
jgi:adenylosuccinate synthase